MATAYFLENHIMGGYNFLMDNYREKDRICLFGFSRGAYTARCLAGMIQKVGLLPKANREQIPFAYSCYRDCTPKGRSRSKAFKDTFSVSVNIDFIGVWDTVSSVGVLRPRHLPTPSSGEAIKYFRHALSLDERRARFKASLWERRHNKSKKDMKEEKQEEKKEKKKEEMEMEMEMTEEPDEEDEKYDGFDDPKVPNPVAVLLDESIAYRGKRSETVDSVTVNGTPIEMLMGTEIGGWRSATTDVQEVWFAGCHADVGGGNTENGEIKSLSGPSLRWMINEIVRCETGILFTDAGLAKLGIDPNHIRQLALYITFQRKHPSAPNPMEAVIKEVKNSQFVRDQVDAECRMHDELKRVPFWKILEYIPIKVGHYDEHGSWHGKWRFNASKARKIYKPDPLFHGTVKLRMDARDLKYTPRAEYEGNPVWVEW
ncbi:hypothetical protein FRC03_012032 [Tulasnella sp. 419]|nr:hypothetical protein FRC03_012032 [Tulasnella sp. 419]